MKKFYTLLFSLLSISLFAQWKYANFPYGGYIYSCASKGNVTLAQSAHGLYRSTNNGSNWNLVDSSINARCFLVHNKTIFAAGNGLYSSSDDGVTWKKLDVPTAKGINSLAAKGDTIYAGEASAIYKSTDYGQTWKTILLNTPTFGVYALTFVGQAIFAGTQPGVFLSSNHGVDWKFLNAPKNVHDFLLKGDTLIAVAMSKVYASKDTGKTWTELGDLITSAHAKKIISIGSTLFLATDDGVYKSINNGANWVASNVGLEVGHYVNTLSANGNNLFAATEHGMYLSLDLGATWTSINNNIIGMHIWRMTKNNTKLFASTRLGIFSSQDHGMSWQWAYKTLNSIGTLDIATNGDTICAAANGGVLISNDNGTTWKFSAVKPMETIGFVGSTIIAGTMDYGLYKSTDNGTSWMEMDTSSSALPAVNISNIYITGNAIFVGTYYLGLYRSLDNGMSWVALTNGLDADLNISSITSIGSTIVIGSAKGVFLSADNGDSWTSINSSATFIYPAVNIIDNILFAGDYQAYLSPINSISWKSINFSSPRAGITSFVKDGNNLFVSTYGAGVWYRPFNEILTTISENTIYQTNFTIFPNPTTGQFTLLQSGSSLIEIFNVVGERVYTSEITDGSSQIDLSKEAKGIYFVKRILNDGSQYAQKIIVQ